VLNNRVNIYNIQFMQTARLFVGLETQF